VRVCAACAPACPLQGSRNLKNYTAPVQTTETGCRCACACAQRGSSAQALNDTAHGSMEPALGTGDRAAAPARARTHDGATTRRAQPQGVQHVTLLCGKIYSQQKDTTMATRGARCLVTRSAVTARRRRRALGRRRGTRGDAPSSQSPLYRSRGDVVLTQSLRCHLTAAAADARKAARYEK
jgi:hypothetical protein